ncbi:hypothetical protein RFI_35662, partial [Reticulomyxa filosa]
MSQMFEEMERYVQAGHSNIPRLATSNIPALLCGVIQGQSQEHSEKTLLFPALQTVQKMIEHPQLHTIFSTLDIIKVTLEVIQKNMSNDSLLCKCVNVLNGLMRDNPSNITRLIELGGVQDITRMMTRHVSAAALMSANLTLLCHLCHRNNDNKKMICEYGGSRCVMTVLSHHYRDPQVIEHALRCLANFSFVEGLTSIVHAHMQYICICTYICIYGMCLMTLFFGKSENVAKLVKEQILEVVFPLFNNHNENEKVLLLICNVDDIEINKLIFEICPSKFEEQYKKNININILHNWKDLYNYYKLELSNPISRNINIIMTIYYILIKYLKIIPNFNNNNDIIIHLIGIDSIEIN